MTKVVITPSGNFTPSKHRNQKRGMTFVDTAGNVIKGDLRKHYLKCFEKQQSRYLLKLEAFQLLSKEQLKDLFLNPVRPTVSGSTDKKALIQAYYNVSFNSFSEQSLDDLKGIGENTINNLDSVEKQSLKDAIEIKEKENTKEAVS
jgi:hypothetical protein